MRYMPIRSCVTKATDLRLVISTTETHLSKNYIDRSYDEKSGYVITRKSQMEYELNPLAYTLYNGEEETQLKLDKWGWQPAY